MAQKHANYAQLGWWSIAWYVQYGVMKRSGFLRASGVNIRAARQKQPYERPVVLPHGSHQRRAPPTVSAVYIRVLAQDAKRIEVLSALRHCLVSSHRTYPAMG